MTLLSNQNAIADYFLSAHRTGPTLVVVFPSDQDDHPPISPRTVVLGLPLLRRVVLTAQRAGFSTILISTSDPSGITPILDGTLAIAVTPSDMSAHIPQGKLVLLTSNVLPTQRSLRWLLDQPLELDRACVFGNVAACIESSEFSTCRSILQDVLRGHASFGEFASACGILLDEEQVEGLYHLKTTQDRREAEHHLLRGLIKDTEGFMSRQLERRISLAITRRLVSTGVTPNAMTVVSVGIGLLGAPFFLSSYWGYQLIGALLFLAHSILDGCDGELARLRFQESRWGGILDFWGDNVVHVAVFACMGLGWSLSVGETWPLWLGGLTVGGTIGSAGMVYRHTMRGEGSTGPLFTSVVRSKTSALSNLMDSLARRDFIYLVVVLSAFGKASWFLALSAIGSPIYFGLLLWIVRRERRTMGGLS
jgi:1L-myo-inositol 1-phosphate cytidylyltransferase / CDP-L-myo-inositol myo-inositolphosphotransferase